MLLASFFKWWYGAGLKNRFSRLRDKLVQTSDFFSIGLLLKTFFQPFRMIDAQKLDKGALEDKLRNWFDRLVSRMIGAMLRLGVLLVGILALVARLVYSFVAMFLWLFIPVAPAACVILFVLGVAPSWLVQ